MIMYDNEFLTKENKICTKDKIAPQHIYIVNVSLSLFGDCFVVDVARCGHLYWNCKYCAI